MSENVALEKFFRAGPSFYRVRVIQDLHCESPRGGTNRSILLTWESSYASPDPRNEVPDYLGRALAKWRAHGDFRQPVAAAGIVRYCRAFLADKVYAVAALRRSADEDLLPDWNPEPDGWYDGIALLTREGWLETMGEADPHAGYAFTRPDGSSGNVTPRSVIEEELAEYNRWGRGECYGYEVEKAVLGGWDEVYSCWGYIEDPEAYPLTAAKAELPEGAVEVKAMPKRREPDERQERYAEGVKGIVLMFEHELCEICGNDLDRHAIAPDPLGLPHAFCLDSNESGDANMQSYEQFGAEVATLGAELGRRSDPKEA